MGKEKMSKCGEKVGIVVGDNIIEQKLCLRE